MFLNGEGIKIKYSTIVLEYYIAVQKLGKIYMYFCGKPKLAKTGKQNNS